MMLGAQAGRRPALLSTRSIAFAALAALSLLIVVQGRSRGNIHTGDSDVLVRGARQVLHCLGNGTFRSCGYVTGTQTNVGPYPFLQYVPAMVLVGIGMSDDAALRSLAILNFVAVIGLVVATLWVWRDRRRLACMAVLAIVATSLLYQSTSGFGEALAACVVAGAVLAAVRRNVVLVTLLVFFASLSKETLAPFIFVLVICVARDEGGRLLPSRTLTIAAGLSAVAGILLSGVFNFFRYGTWRNRLYLDPLFRTPGLGRKVDFLGGILFSPSSGTVWCWPVCMALLFLLAVVLIRRSRRDGLNEWRGWISLAGVVGCALVWFVGLSVWFSPFGWIAYGPRLEVPLLPALVVAVIHLAGDEILDLVRRVPLITVVMFLAVLFSVAQYQSVWRYSQVIDRLIAPNGDCPAMTVPLTLGSPKFYECTSRAMWRTRPVALGGLIGADSGAQWATWPLAAVASFGLAWSAASDPAGKEHMRRLRHGADAD